MKSRIEIVCDRIMVHGLGIMGLLIATCFSFKGYNMLLIKTALLDAGAAILACAWIVKTLERRRLEIDGPVRWLLLPAFVFLLSAVLSYAFVTTSRDTSFDELVSRVPYFVVMAIAALEFREMRTTVVFMRWLMTAAFGFSLYGLVQHFQLIPGLQVPEGRIFSTFGNPNFFVGFLIPMIALVLSFFDYGNLRDFKKLVPCIAVAIGAPILYYAVTYAVTAPVVRGGIFMALLGLTVAICLARCIGARTITVLLLFLLISNILLTSSRSGQIGMSVMLVIFAILLSVFAIRAGAAKKALFVAGIGVVAIALMLAGVLFLTKSRSNSTMERKYFAQGAVDLIKQKPILGHGIGTFKNNYPLVRRTESWKYNLVCFQFTSNVYNEFLEIWHDEGVVGLAIFLWLLVMIYGSGISSVKRVQGAAPAAAENAGTRRSWLDDLYAPSPAVMLIGLMSGTAALLISNIFSLSMRYSATGFIFWTLLGLIAARAAPASAGERNGAVKGLPRTTIAVRLAQVFALIIAGMCILAAFRYYRADVYMDQAVRHSVQAYRAPEQSGEIFHDIYIEGTSYISDPAEWELAIAAYRTALNDNPHYLRARYFLANSFNRRWNMTPVCNPAWGDAPGAIRTDAQRALALYENICRQAPDFIEIDLERGDLYLKLGNIDSSIAAYNLYKRYRPFFTKIHTALARAYTAKQDWANAAEAYKDALDLNKRFVLGYCELSAVYRMMGDTALSREAYDRAAEGSSHGAPEIMARVFVEHKNWEMAIEFTRRLIGLDTLNAKAYSDLGWYFVKLEKWPQAIDAYERAVRLDSADLASLITLSNLYYQEQRLDESKEAYRKAMAADPAAVQRIVESADR